MPRLFVVLVLALMLACWGCNDEFDGPEPPEGDVDAEIDADSDDDVDAAADGDVDADEDRSTDGDVTDADAPEGHIPF